MDRDQKPGEWYSEIADAKTKLGGDNFHDLKRIGSFLWFDKILDSCEKDSCPIDYLVSPILYALTDISIEGYVLQKAHYLSEARKGSDDDERYYSGMNRITKVLDCRKETILGRNVFEIDSKEVVSKEGNETTYYGVRQRKAYWRFLEHSSGNNEIDDFVESCGFIKKIHTISNQQICTESDVQTVKQLLKSNSHIANPLDLLRLCMVRQMVIKD